MQVGDFVRTDNSAREIRYHFIPRNCLGIVDHVNDDGTVDICFYEEYMYYNVPVQYLNIVEA